MNLDPCVYSPGSDWTPAPRVSGPLLFLRIPAGFRNTAGRAQNPTPHCELFSHRERTLLVRRENLCSGWFVQMLRSHKFLGVFENLR